MSRLQLNKIYSKKDTIRIEQSLKRLRKYIPQEFIITGGVSIAHHLIENNLSVKHIKINDIDILINLQQDLNPKLTDDFLVNHYHPNTKRGKMLIQLVDKQTKLRIDIFTVKNKQMMETSEEVLVNSQKLKVINLEGMVSQIFSICSDILDNNVIESKYFINLLLLFPLTSFEYRLKSDSEFCKILQKIKSEPKYLTHTEYSKDVGSICEKCVSDLDFQLANKTEVFEALGFV